VDKDKISAIVDKDKISAIVDLESKISLHQDRGLTLMRL
jgi:hypothetical protein